MTQEELVAQLLTLPQFQKLGPYMPQIQAQQVAPQGMSADPSTPVAQGTPVDVPQQTFNNPNVGLTDPTPAFQDNQRLARLQSQMAAMDAPPKPQNWLNSLIQNSAEGVAYGKQLPQMRANEFEQQRQKRLDLANEAQQLMQNSRQRQLDAANLEHTQNEDARAQYAENRAEALFPAQQRDIEAQVAERERQAKLPSPTTTVDIPAFPELGFGGMKGVPKEIAAPIIAQFGQLAKQEEKPKVPGVDVPFSPDVEAQRIRIEQAKKKAETEGNYGDLADLVVKNPDLLKDMRKETAEGVMSLIHSTGRSIEAPKVDLQRTMVNKALDTVKYLKDNMSATGGGAGAVGAKGPSSLFGALSNPIAGTAAADYALKHKSLKDQLTLPNLDILKGLGRVTQKEFEALQGASTSLDRSMREGTYLDELNTIESTLQKMKEGLGASPTTQAAPSGQRGGPTGGQNRVIQFDKNGNRIGK